MQSISDTDVHKTILERVQKYIDGYAITLTKYINIIECSYQNHVLYIVIAFKWIIIIKPINCTNTFNYIGF
jgi:hypothetical protein